jgi:hypothetical protein
MLWFLILFDIKLSVLRRGLLIYYYLRMLDFSIFV